MRIIQDVRNCNEAFPELVLTVGSFDGLHLGHQRILDELIRRTRERSGTAALMSLHPHPREVFAPEHAPNILTPEAKKRTLIEAAGVDVWFRLPFDARVAAMTPEHFLDEIVVDRCQAKELVIGHDFTFGRDAGGDIAWLERVAPARGILVHEVPALYVDGERVSSTAIRERILQGDLEQAARFLGRPYSITGEVVHGRGIGVKLGFPTANIHPHHSAVPAHGVYLAEAILDEGVYPAAVNIGIAPTVRHDDLVIEAHLLDFHGDLTGARIEIVFHRRLRPEQKFHSREELVTAIDADVAHVRQYFAGLS